MPSLYVEIQMYLETTLAVKFKEMEKCNAASLIHRVTKFPVRTNRLNRNNPLNLQIPALIPALVTKVVSLGYVLPPKRKVVARF
jgi:hypothetical protein